MVETDISLIFLVVDADSNGYPHVVSGAWGWGLDTPHKTHPSVIDILVLSYKREE
jgi:hypothetical protein